MSKRQWIDAVEDIINNSMSICIPRIKCEDGFTVSIQASNIHHCERSSDETQWSRFELGFPSEVDFLIEGYAANSNASPNTTYNYVPRNVVEKLLTRHGGIAKSSLIPLYNGWYLLKHKDATDPVAVEYSHGRWHVGGYPQISERMVEAGYSYYTPNGDES